MTEEWLRSVVDAGEVSDQAATATVNFVVTGGPDGEVRYFWELVDGRVVRAGLGDVADADVTFTQTYADAQRMCRGDFDASEAFMQGRMKFAGDMAKLMAAAAPLLPAISSIAARAAA
ncbi:MAG: SCP2 sterol-binding domain-containing protein [Acidimicrobiia bacterium]